MLDENMVGGVVVEQLQCPMAVDHILIRTCDFHELEILTNALEPRLLQTLASAWMCVIS